MRHRQPKQIIEIQSDHQDLNEVKPQEIKTHSTVSNNFAFKKSIFPKIASLLRKSKSVPQVIDLNVQIKMPQPQEPQPEEKIVPFKDENHNNEGEATYLVSSSAPLHEITVQEDLIGMEPDFENWNKRKKNFQRKNRYLKENTKNIHSQSLNKDNHPSTEISHSKGQQIFQKRVQIRQINHEELANIQIEQNPMQILEEKNQQVIDDKEEKNQIALKQKEVEVEVNNPSINFVSEIQGRTTAIFSQFKVDGSHSVENQIDQVIHVERNQNQSIQKQRAVQNSPQLLHQIRQVQQNTSMNQNTFLALANSSSQTEKRPQTQLISSEGNNQGHILTFQKEKESVEIKAEDKSDMNQFKVHEERQEDEEENNRLDIQARQFSENDFLVGSQRNIDQEVVQRQQNLLLFEINELDHEDEKLNFEIEATELDIKQIQEKLGELNSDLKSQLSEMDDKKMFDLVMNFAPDLIEEKIIQNKKKIVPTTEYPSIDFIIQYCKQILPEVELSIKTFTETLIKEHFQRLEKQLKNIDHEKANPESPLEEKEDQQEKNSIQKQKLRSNSLKRTYEEMEKTCEANEGLRRQPSEGKKRFAPSEIRKMLISKLPQLKSNILMLDNDQIETIFYQGIQSAQSRLSLSKSNNQTSKSQQEVEKNQNMNEEIEKKGLKKDRRYQQAQQNYPIVEFIERSEDRSKRKLRTIVVIQEELMSDNEDKYTNEKQSIKNKCDCKCCQELNFDKLISKIIQSAHKQQK